MYYAPIGLGCYFASFTGTFGASVTQGFVKMLVIYTILVLFVYFVIYSLYAYMAAGRLELRNTGLILFLLVLLLYLHVVLLHLYQLILSVLRKLVLVKILLVQLLHLEHHFIRMVLL